MEKEWKSSTRQKKIYDITLYYDQKDEEGNHIYHGKILIDDSFYFEGVISDKDYIKGIILSPQEYSFILMKNDNKVIDHYYCVREEVVNHYTVYKDGERKEEGNFSMGLHLTKQTEEESMFRNKLQEQLILCILLL